MNTAVAKKVEQTWVEVCSKADLQPNSGLCALIHQKQVAIFYSKTLDEVFAIGNYDPVGKANVLSRGIIGSLGERTVVASPLYKEHYDLRTGECLESDAHSVPVYPVRVENGVVSIQV
ncbi:MULTISPECIES: nitrite reductase small subunit NirD [unclassified Marinimicrobium]|jgi:nitrite reductase (NADH) small subunit|uniref:nitrite reductase small subunit NirD n=1 Tax=unclassified Marinimicrobium TaxID=2632100 RepID=UPI000463E4A6|nr:MULTISPECIES: nitrite reductase small subunit NirD [unclassified Marinimicrobium]MAN52930.1 nitrite reductase (NAD(P)H) small subunit [Marinimicrobium sp.]|tara:strand:+ start:361 stop:714 length:354 start_codon:yes stop_codon:yes gene_type:complete